MFRNLPIVIIILIGIIILCSAETTEAKMVLTFQELKEMIIKEKIYIMYRTDDGLSGVDKNQYDLPSEEFIVTGRFEEIPVDIVKLAKEHHVILGQSQQSGKRNDMPILQMIVTAIWIGTFILVVLFLGIINRKLTKVVKLLSKNGTRDDSINEKK